jgi:hypothetical protein
MSTIVYRTRWRPLRIGWCVRSGDMSGLTRAFRLSHCLWGGRFNPIIVVDDEANARLMTDVFRVDVLWAISKDERCLALAKSVKHLPSPFFSDDLFQNRANTKQCVLLDVTHPIRSFFEHHVRDKSNPEHATLYSWLPDDPLAGVFDATFGGYPDVTESGIDYRNLVIRYTAAREQAIKPTDIIGDGAVDAISPNTLTSVQLRPELSAEKFHYRYGVFIGEADSFQHLVEFWNLRAADIDAFFLDPRQRNRLEKILKDLERIVGSLPPHPILGLQRLGIWLAHKNTDEELKRFTVPLEVREVNQYTWDDRIWKGSKIQPPLMQFGDHSSVAQISEGEPRPTVTFDVRERPGFDDPPFNSQQLVLTVKPTLNYSRDDRFLFTVPFIPEMNEYFGRAHHYHWNSARAEKDGLGIVTHLWTEHITLFGMERFSFARELFKTFGIAAELSQPGLICDQLIRQMGGPQGCRVFKIKGVRTLIEKFGPAQHFTRSDAMRLIGNVDPVTNSANFSEYEHLHIEPRDKDRLTPQDAFSFLLKQRVFRVGLQLKCPSCQLEFWRPLDDVSTAITCEYCGKEFNCTPQLKDRDWAYRPSGLFGRGDNQEGGVPVALTLQQLEIALGDRPMLWLPGLNLRPLTANIDTCESDFVLLCQDYRGRVTLIMGECKTNKQIEADDVANLSKVADAFPSDRFDVFLVFSKTGEFTPEEVQRCRAADSGVRGRTILLSARELEPYFLYERAAKQFAINQTAVSPEDMVEATRGIYFEPRPKT